MPSFAVTKAKAIMERREFYAFQVLPGGKTKRLTPFGLKTFGSTALAWQKARAKRKGWKLIVKKVAKSPEQRRRDLVVAEVRDAEAHESLIHYLQSRPFPVNVFVHVTNDREIKIDCSAYVTCIHRASGYKDPNGRGYDGYGYTGTIRTVSPRIDFTKLYPGCLIVYGTGDGEHVVIVIQGGPDPIVSSHGQESGPRRYRHSQQVAAHGGYFTCHAPRT